MDERVGAFGRLAWPTAIAIPIHGPWYALASRRAGKTYATANESRRRIRVVLSAAQRYSVYVTKSMTLAQCGVEVNRA